MSTYNELLNYEKQEAKKKADAYALERRTGAERRAAESDALYEQERAAVQRQANTTLAQTEASFADAYDVNAVDELVARRRVSEAIANSNAVNSGLNNTQHTALSLSRSRADAQVTAARQSAIERVMQALDEREADIAARAAEDRAAIYDDADKDIADYREEAEEQAWDNADRRYKSGDSETKTVYAGGGSINADMTYTPSYVTVSTNARMRQRNHNDEMASGYLHNMFGAGYISFSQWKRIHDTLSIKPCAAMSLDDIAEVMEQAATGRGEKEARLFVEYLLQNGTIDTAEADSLMQKLYAM